MSSKKSSLLSIAGENHKIKKFSSENSPKSEPSLIFLKSLLIFPLSLALLLLFSFALSYTADMKDQSEVDPTVFSREL